jgi:competence protein ComEC
MATEAPSTQASGHQATGLAERLQYLFYYRPLVWLAIAVSLGIKLPLPSRLGDWSLLGLLLSLLLGTLVTAYALHRRQLTKSAASAAIVAAIWFGAYLSYTSRPPARDGLSDLATRKAEPLAARGFIGSAATWKPNPHYRASDPSSPAWQTSWDIHCEEVRDGSQWRPIAAYCTLTVDGRVDDLLPGDHVEVMGSLRSISPPTNPGAFDFAHHFQQHSQFVALFAKNRQQVTRLGSSWHWPLHRLRAWLVRHVDQTLSRWVTGGHSPLAAALVFGQREQVDWEDQQDLMATGTLHMLAISGLHVEIVASTILLLSAPLAWRNSTLLIVIVAVCGSYAMLAGAQPPVLRAVIVVCAFALARTLGRPARLSNILGLAALLLLVMRTTNIDSAGVQLSFLAVGTIGVFMVDQRHLAEQRTALKSVLEASFSRWKRWWLKGLKSLQQMGRLSLWVWLITLPLVWTHFHIIAPVAIPLNVLIALPLTISLVSGLGCGVFGWLAPVGWFSGLICSTSLSLITWLVALCAQLPLGHLWLPAPPLWWTLCFYGLLALWLIVFGLTRNVGLLGMLGMWIAVGIAPHAFGPRGWWGDTLAYSVPWVTDETPPIPELRCTFLDVGHGTSVIIELPNDEVWLYDAGHLGTAERSHQDIATALWSVPTARIAKLFISHADADHYNATGGLAERFQIDRLASPSQFWNSSDRDVQGLLARLGTTIVREQTNAGTTGTMGDVHYQVLHPRADWSGENDNAASLCLLLEYAGKRVLLPGDVEKSGLLALTELPPRPCHILMAPHHGSLTIDPSQLLEWCRPEWTIISGNHRATRPEVLQKYETADSQLAITFRDGAVQIRIDAQGQLTAWQWQRTAWQRLPARP